MEGILQSALFKSLVSKYGFEYASKLLGLDQQTRNPKYAISLGGKTFDAGNMFKRAGLNQGIKTLMGGSKMGMAVPLLAGGLGLAYLRNPLRPGSMNYNPYLKGQMDYLSESNMIGPNPGSGLTQYGPGSVLSGQNVVSLFGTNDYIDQLNKYKDKYGKTMPKERLKKLNREIADYELDQVNKELQADELKTLQNINAGNNNGGGNDGGAPRGVDAGSANVQDYADIYSYGGRVGYSQGGIASLWQR